jgi:hypothetical protein
MPPHAPEGEELDHFPSECGDVVGAAAADATLGRQPGITLDPSVLRFDRAAHSSTTLRNSDEASAAGALYDGPMTRRWPDRSDRFAAPGPRQRAILLRSSEPAAADDIGDQNRGNFPSLGHGEARPPPLSLALRRLLKTRSGERSGSQDKLAWDFRRPNQARFSL